MHHKIPGEKCLYFVEISSVHTNSNSCVPGCMEGQDLGERPETPALCCMDKACSALKSWVRGTNQPWTTRNPKPWAHLWELGDIWSGGGWRRQSPRVVSSDFWLTDLKAVQDLLAGSSYL